MNGIITRLGRARGIAAVVAALVVLLSVLVPTGAATAAADYSYPGTSMMSWTQLSNSSAGGQLPGNLAALPGATLSISSSTQTVQAGSGTQAEGMATHTNGGSPSCITGKQRYQMVTCETFTYTVTFRTPLVDPIVPFGISSGRYWATSEGMSKGCIIGWYDGTLSSINGGAATTAGYSILRDPDGKWVRSGAASWVYPQSAVNANTCVNEGTNSFGMLQLKGSISSFSFTVAYRSAIVIPWTAWISPERSGPTGQFATVVLLPQVDLSVKKTGPATVAGGGTITWGITVSNLGPYGSHGFIVRDAVPASVSNPSIVSAPAGCSLSGRDLICASPPPGCSIQNTAVTTVAQLSCSDPRSADQVMLAAGGSFGPIQLSGTAPSNAGSVITNTATVAGADLDPNVSNNSSSVSTTVTQAPSLSIAKQAALAPGATGKAGDTVNYTFTATNTGNVTLTGVTIADPLPGLSGLVYQWPGAAGTLLAGQSVTATATYRLTQADVDAGAVSNVATATGRDPGGASVDGGRAPATVTLNPKPALTMTKQGALAPGATGKAGDRITYTFSATNIGDVTLQNVAISDPHPGLSGLVYQWPGTPGVLAPGQKVTATASYTITQADVDAGRVDNTATAAGATLAGTPVDGGRASVTIPLAGNPRLALTKTAKLAVGATGVVGDRVEYTFTATNTGDQTLRNVTVADQLAGMSALTYQWPGVPGTLLPGQSVTATATYTIAQKDVDAGSVNNVATATGTAPDGGAVPSGPAQATVPLNASPELTLTKSAQLVPGQSGVAGDTIQYSFTVINTGRVTVNNVAITDRLAGMSALTYQWPGAPGVLTPGQRVTATATYTVKQSDIDAGSVTNVAVADGTTPSGAPVASNNATATVPLSRTASLNVTKAAALAPRATGKAGDTVNYTFSATNTGPLSLKNVVIVDPLDGLSAMSYQWPGAEGILKPGQSVVATATYVIKQSDVDAGGIWNTAIAHGDLLGRTSRAPVSRMGGTPVNSNIAEVALPLEASHGLELTAMAGLRQGAQGVAGDTVDYVFSIANTGGSTLAAVTVDDQLAGMSPGSYDWPDAPGVLPPGATATMRASYVVTQADVDAGSVANRAVATGTDAGGETAVSRPAQAAVVLATTSRLTLAVTGALAPGETAGAGGQVRFTLAASNTGALTLSSIRISDQLSGLSDVDYEWPAEPGTLAPGQSVAATASYRLTQADVDAGALISATTAEGAAPNGTRVTAGPVRTTVELAAAGPAGSEAVVPHVSGTPDASATPAVPSTPDTPAPDAPSAAADVPSAAPQDSAGSETSVTAGGPVAPETLIGSEGPVAPEGTAEAAVPSSVPDRTESAALSDGSDLARTGGSLPPVEIAGVTLLLLGGLALALRRRTRQN